MNVQPLRRRAHLAVRVFRLLRQVLYATVLIAVASSTVAPTSASPIEVPEGVWLVDANSALQIFDCNGLLCGRVAWLRNVRDGTGQIQRDGKNPDPALRQRLVCGLTVLWGLQAIAAGSWKGGWFYNPDDGKTYRAAADLGSSDTLVARIYVGAPHFGTTRTLLRIPRHSSNGWC